LKDEVEIEKEVEKELNREFVAADSDEDSEAENGEVDDFVESEEEIEVSFFRLLMDTMIDVYPRKPCYLPPSIFTSSKTIMFGRSPPRRHKRFTL